VLKALTPKRKVKKAITLNEVLLLKPGNVCIVGFEPVQPILVMGMSNFFGNAFHVCQNEFGKYLSVRKVAFSMAKHLTFYSIRKVNI